MADRNPARMAAKIDGDFVVFLIGARFHKPWKVWEWLPTARAMGRMLKELAANPDDGLLGIEAYGKINGVLVQYWRSFEDLERYARAKDREHMPFWVAFNRKAAESESVGIWHETYAVKAGSYEAIYRNCPPLGLGAASELVPATGREKTASGRMGAEDPAEYPEEADVGV